MVGVGGVTEILLAGGFSASSGGILNSAELFSAPSISPCSEGSFAAAGGPMQAARELHGAVLLDSQAAANVGDVLIVGGQSDQASVLSSAELYRP